MAPSEDEAMTPLSDGEDDLFGDDEPEVAKVRELGDRDLDSGDDEDRDDRHPRADEQELQYAERDAQIQDVKLMRHGLPTPVDEELSFLRMPKFLGIDPYAFDPDTFKIPDSDHHLDTKSANFSANAVSASTIRFRKNPSTGQLESNTNFYKWSDGSTTIGVGNQHFELLSKSLAPAPTSKTYQEVQDSHTYIATPSYSAQVLLLVGHMTNEYTVRPNKDVEDDALERLQKGLAAAARGGKKDDKGGPELIFNTEDPELQKKKAEQAEKERLKAQRRRETANEKASGGRPMGGRGGLNVDDLEGRRRAPASRAKPKPRRHRPDYDSDDELPRGGRHREDEYDKEDDFLASSDEEEELVEDDEEEEEESERDEPKPKKQKLSQPKEVSDEDAEGELDDENEPAAPIADNQANRGRKRNIIEDDDDE